MWGGLIGKATEWDFKGGDLGGNRPFVLRRLERFQGAKKQNPSGCDSDFVMAFFKKSEEIRVLTCFICMLFVFWGGGGGVFYLLRVNNELLLQKIYDMGDKL